MNLSTLTANHNSTVQWSSQIVICLKRHFTRIPPNDVRVEVWYLVKSCRPVMRCCEFMRGDKDDFLKDMLIVGSGAALKIGSFKPADVAPDN